MLFCTNAQACALLYIYKHTHRYFVLPKDVGGFHLLLNNNITLWMEPEELNYKDDPEESHKYTLDVCEQAFLQVRSDRHTCACAHTHAPLYTPALAPAPAPAPEHTSYIQVQPTPREHKALTDFLKELKVICVCVCVCCAPTSTAATGSASATKT